MRLIQSSIYISIYLCTVCRAQLSGTILNTDFVYVPNTDLKTEHLNSALICTSIKVEVCVCMLSAVWWLYVLCWFTLFTPAVVSYMTSLFDLFVPHSALRATCRCCY